MADAATEFFGQANEFNSSLGSYVGSAAVALVKADIQAKQANAGLLESLLVLPDGKTPRPNVKVTQTFTFADGNGDTKDVEFDIDEPVFLLTDLTSFLPQTAEIEMSMNVDAQAEDTSSYSAQESASGEGSVGWGPFKASVKISATAAEKGSSTRKSDYRSKSHCKLTMGRSDTPEGVQRINDLLTDLGDIAKQMTKQRARDAAQKAATDGGLTPGGNGGSGGGGGNGDNNS